MSAGFDIPMRQFISGDGSVTAKLPVDADDQTTSVALYQAMVKTRSFDQRAVSLQRSGQLGTYASSLGQEAVSVGVGHAMAETDVLLPSFREHGTQLLRGVTMLELLRFWGGDERGSDYGAAREDFPVSVPIGSHAPQAVGVGFAMKLRGEERAALCVLGDGATSKGDFYEAINMAGVWSLPVVFVVTNNQWAISLPRARQTAAKSIAHKAVAAGIEARRVDGNDVLAVSHETDEALRRARRGDGPTLIEAETYRLADHTTADDSRRYRDEGEVARAWKTEPLIRMRRFLEERDWWSADLQQALEDTVTHEVKEAVDAYLADPPQAPSAMFDHLFADLPEEIVVQRKALLDEVVDDG